MEFLGALELLGTLEFQGTLGPGMGPGDGFGNAEQAGGFAAVTASVNECSREDGAENLAFEVFEASALETIGNWARIFNYFCKIPRRWETDFGRLYTKALKSNNVWSCWELILEISNPFLIMK